MDPEQCRIDLQRRLPAGQSIHGKEMLSSTPQVTHGIEQMMASNRHGTGKLNKFIILV
jgi:hypothetical protein